ncbi:hypothetical protein ASPZODRAFT_21083 [Penicilliopsis zonata CBS 506.65]|uniref:tRNA pseudouridine synthase 1 n=1 Tax=Penicilliopsis zonata CBS 506.65 TaxID=1073090 RepID=A0A1L9STW5_9EURO|nr:hypothetical protein ASPZODRAFT_21083 [Penicilliopsis zonata CBS 506.65]OJJ50523.1 hypothetical protein ASPZODRAFT_21083 [Penicilliopsis zonata CBS 506.65]
MDASGEQGGAGDKRKRRDMGRSEWSRQQTDKRGQNEQLENTKRQKREKGEFVTPIYATHFPQEDIDSEKRRPKKKVAVLLGYSGTGYHGMQMSTTEKTIEGELFAAFVAADAISKANAADPKKSSFVRCARTDKGVHAAGNIVSLKMIVEDPDLVQKINEKLSPQIRVWGIELANKSFSCYQMCDSRIYEYLIPTHCFIPPHPSTHLGRALVKMAEKEGDLDAYKARQEEVASFWDETDENYVKPILEQLPEDIRDLVEKALHIGTDDTRASSEEREEKRAPADQEETQESPAASLQATEAGPDASGEEAIDPKRLQVIQTVKQIKAAYLKAKKAYRIPPARLQRVQAALDKYLGTKRFWNYTIQKTYTDPSAKRLIKSFNANPTPIIINGTEWLSMKVHGQSFMMHQIRKMVAMVALVVRCGCDPERIDETYGPTRIAIPKAPGLGLLLERPVFTNYSRKAVESGKNPIDFDKYDKEISEFKQREIYDRIFREEEESNAFNLFFNHIDHFPGEEFLYITSGGVKAAKPVGEPSTAPVPAGETAKQDEGSATLKKTEQQEESNVLASVEVDGEEDTDLPKTGEEEG